MSDFMILRTGKLTVDTHCFDVDNCCCVHWYSFMLLLAGNDNTGPGLMINYGSTQAHTVDLFHLFTTHHNDLMATLWRHRVTLRWRPVWPWDDRSRTCTGCACGRREDGSWSDRVDDMKMLALWWSWAYWKGHKYVEYGLLFFVHFIISSIVIWLFQGN